MQTNEKTRVLVVGFGFMGQTHAANLLKLPDAQLAGIVDIENPADRIRHRGGNIATVQFDIEQLGSIPWYQDLTKALGELRPDAAVIALPTSLHQTPSEQCLSAGCNVFCEKPFAVTVEECDSVCNCAERKGKLIAIGYVVRFSGEHVYLYDTVKSGRLGRLEYLASTRFAGRPDWGFWKTDSVYAKQNATLFDMLCHDLDFTRHLLGAPNTVLGAVCGAEQVAVLDYGDTQVKCEAGFINPSSFPFNQGYMACFEKGTIVSHSMGSCIEYNADGTLEKSFPEDPYMAEIRAFIDACRTGCTSRLCLGREALETTRCCVSLQKQARPQ